MKTFLLVGAGHAHLEVIRRLLIERPTTAPEVTLVTLGTHHHYSGMVPGYLADQYREDEIAFDLAPICQRAGVELRCGKAVRVDLESKTVVLSDGSRLGWDWISFNLGSRTLGSDDVSVAEHIEKVKPISRAVRLYQRLGDWIESGAPGGATVVGGGAAGVEVACAIRARLRKAGRISPVRIIDRSATILSNYPERFRSRAADILRRQEIEVVTKAGVASVTEREVRLSQDGRSFPSQLTVWLTGPVASPLFRDSGLQVDARGFLLVDNALRSLSSPEIFAVGDCATLAEFPETPKAGVYAVRESPILWASLKATWGDGALPSYQPQAKFLSLLNTCDGRALMDYKGWVVWSRLALRLKDWIDRRFMDRFRGVL